MRRMFPKLWILAVSLGAWAVLGNGTASGGLLPVDATVTQSGSAYQYSYTVDLTSDSSLIKGDYFTIYGFNGYIPSSNQIPAGFTETVSTNGPVPPGIAPIGNNGGVDVTFTYTGSTTLTGPLTLGNFIIDSTIGATSTGSFASQTHLELACGTEESNITSTVCPVPSSTPEPATFLLLGMALPVVGLTRWMRRKDVA